MAGASAKRRDQDDAPNQDYVVITPDTLPLGSLADRVVCPTAGAIATFIGTTRDNFDGKKVLRLEYEAYQPMAEREMHAIIAEARKQWDLRHVAIAHRTGVVPTTESSVEIAISSAHRREALEAVHFVIDKLKAQVPIWKKEVYEGESASWKENKESAAPTIGQAASKATGQGGGQSTAIALVGTAVALGVLALSSAALRKRP